MDGFIGYGVITTSLMLLFLISSLSQVNFTFAQSQAADGLFPPTIIASSSTDTTPNSLKLLATQAEGAAVQEVSGFSLDTLDNITAQPDSQLLVFVSDSSLGVVGAKASTTSGEIIDLVPSTSQQATNSFSLANLPAGVYVLDVLTQKGNTRGVYEGILEIGSSRQQRWLHPLYHQRRPLYLVQRRLLRPLLRHQTNNLIVQRTVKIVEMKIMVEMTMEMKMMVEMKITGTLEIKMKVEEMKVEEMKVEEMKVEEHPEDT